MALFELSFPPGLYANGTRMQARGRWHDANLVRFSNQTVRPWGGWTAHLAEGEDPLSGSARAVIAWSDNSGNRWIAVGTHDHLYVVNRLGEVFDITPAGLAPGLPSAAIGGGYGSEGYGEGAFGVSGGDAELVQPATVWSLDTFGENLIALNNADGKLYKWSLDTSSAAETVVASGSTEVPENSRALVVEDTGHILILGAGGDGRCVQWCDAEDETLWDAGLPSEAGSFPLQTGGRLMAGRRTRGGTLLLTDQDAWVASYNGGANPFSFDQGGTGCGAISQGCLATAGTGLAAWMGTDGFWFFNGTVESLPCEVSDRVFGDLNRTLASHVTCYYRAAHAEFVWHYASAGAAEVDRYVAWCHRENYWTTGSLSRLCGCDRGAFAWPLAVDGDGRVWRHETGFDYGEGVEPFVESGPVEFVSEFDAPGERVFTALDLIPDENTLGDVQATFFGRLFPSGEEQIFGPYPAANPTNVRITARHLRLRLSGARGADWRAGAFRLDVRPGGTR